MFSRKDFQLNVLLSDGFEWKILNFPQWKSRIKIIWQCAADDVWFKG